MTKIPQNGWPLSVVGYSADNWVCALATLRITGPLRACGIRFIEGNDGSGIHPERVALADVVVIQRDFPRYAVEYARIIELARAEGKSVIYDIDDLIFELPSDHPDHQSGYYADALAGMLLGMVEADAVTVSTEALKSYYSAFNPNIWVLPNYLDDQIWGLTPPSTPSISSAPTPVVIGFMGGDSHLRDLESLEPVLRKLGQRYGNKITLRFCGCRPPASLTESFDLCPVEWIQLSPTNYAHFASLFAQVRCDIAIAPLEDNLFNRSKSPIKYLEYSALGMPAVYSHIPPYADVITNGVTGFLARNNQDWEHYLCALIDDPALRHQIGVNALGDIQRKWLLPEHADQWRTAYQHIAASGASDHSSPVIRAMKQMQTWQRRRDMVIPFRNDTADTVQANSLLRQEVSHVQDWARAILAQHGQVSPEHVTTASLLSDVEQSLALIAAQAEQRAVAYGAQLIHANELKARVAQLEQHAAALAQYSTNQNKLIQGLLNGRLMRTLIGTQTWLANMLGRKDSPAAKGVVIAPVPAPLPPSSAGMGIAQPLEDSREISAVLGAQLKQALKRIYRHTLESFISAGQRLELPTANAPTVSIIIPVHNQAELTLQCLLSLQSGITATYEVIVVDDGSTNETRDMLSHVSGVKIIRNTENLHYLRSCNRAAAQASGQYLLFLNNDAQLLAGAVDAALRTIRSAPDDAIGAVGARIIQLDGALQEAGSIVWSDGSCLGYGRGDDPTAPPYMFMRDVDYVSGAFLLTPRALFAQIGGFDERFAPAYYEDTDYCLTLQEMGKRVIYDPDAVILHYETASYRDNRANSAVQLQERNRVTLVKKHAKHLKQHYASGNKTAELLARSTVQKKRILYIDDRVPHAALGAGFPRAREILLALVESGYDVTMYPLTMPSEAWGSVYHKLPRTVEVITNSGVENLETFLAQRWWYYDTILISRPHNARDFNQVRERHPDWFIRARIVYDAEAIYALRTATQRQLAGEVVDEAELQAQVEEEVNVANGAHAVMCISTSERDQFMAASHKNVHVVGHAITSNPTPNAFAERNGLLFVGNIEDDTTPNADAVFWFSTDILPMVRQQLGLDAILTVVGHNGSDKIGKLDGAGVRFVERTDDLPPYHNQARIFVAPTRFAAGIPLKVVHAAAHGVPVVCTSLLASELGWRDGIEVLVGDDPASFAAQCVRLYSDQALWEKLRLNALGRVEQEYSRESFRVVIARAISGVD